MHFVRWPSGWRMHTAQCRMQRRRYWPDSPSGTLWRKSTPERSETCGGRGVQVTRAIGLRLQRRDTIKE